MANRRMISKTIKESKKVLRLYNNGGDKNFIEFTLLLYTWLIPFTDDFGHMDAEADVVKNTVMPFSDRTIDEFDKALINLHQASLIKLYIVDGERFLEIIQFEKFQTFKNDRNRISEFPDPKTGIPWNPPESIVSDMSAEVKLREVKLSKEVAPPADADLIPSPIISDEELKTIEELSDLSERLYKTNAFKKVNAFVNKYQKEGKHPGSILHALRRIRDRDIRKYPDPWSYGVSVINVESGNYYERDNIKQHEALKEAMK